MKNFKNRPIEIPPNRKSQWLRVSAECSPLDVGKTELTCSAYDDQDTGARLSTATKPKTQRTLTSDEPARNTRGDFSHSPFSDHPITRSTDHPASLTALQSFILSTIHRHGPQSESALWNHSKCESLPAICRAVATLAEAGFIEHTPAHKNPYRFPLVADPKYWQLTQSGRAAAVAACNGKAQSQKQEVCLGS